ncbi:MAG: EAL domain-containing protein [Gammaproteobacteria bacterium]
MKKAYREYEKHFKKAEQIYLSDEWRADYPFLNDIIQPTFEKAHDLVTQYEKQLEVSVGQTIQNSYQVAEKITSLLWLVGAIVLFVLFVAYVMFEYLLRKPIEQVAHALDAEAKGEAFSPLMQSKTRETSMLIDAFKNMQEQVHSRQMRLTSILENAAEGIITIDKDGVIETFNSAAEKLFGYDDSEIIGKNISVLIPEVHRDDHDTLFKNAINKTSAQNFQMELEVSALNKAGKTIPVSIKLSDLMVEGRRLFTAIVGDISERKAMIENLRELAEHDSLTGLYNRFYFMEELERVVERTQRDHLKQDSLLYIDLDNFKYVNDTLGHLAGDCLLVEVTELLTSRTRKSDLLARIGGDEFAILLYEVDRETAQSVAEQYRALLQDYVFKYEGKVVDVGCSIGIAMLEDDVLNKDDVLSRADFSCHIAKLEGRNKVHLYTEKDKEQINILSDDIGWTRRIKSSLENNQFIIAKQPIVDASLQGTNKYEVLLRMVDINNNLIMPSGFLQPAERFGLMVDIDKWVIRHALSMMKEEAKQTPDIEYSINLSAQSFESSELVNVITEEINKYKLNPAAITFEITETVAMADIGLAVKFLTTLRALGCKTALDDFGVGYSSFAYLKDLPVDYVKIDGSFVRDVENNPLNKTILKSISDVAQAMDKKTIAEFVESKETVRILELIGVDYVQGLYIGKPEIPTSEYERLGMEAPKPELKVVS